MDTKIEEILKKINKLYKEILEDNPKYCGSIMVNFYMGGITHIEKKETVKTK